MHIVTIMVPSSLKKQPDKMHLVMHSTGTVKDEDTLADEDASIHTPCLKMSHVGKKR